MKKSLFTGLITFIAGLFIVFPSSPLFGQNQDKQAHLEELEAQLAKKGQMVLNGPDEQSRKEANLEFKALLADAFNLPELSFDHPFDKVKNLSVLFSPDKEVKLYNWNLPLDDGKYQYFCFLQHKTKEGIETFELNDKSEDIDKPEQQTLDHDHWYGALYYDIIHEKKVGKKYYTLLGWDGNNVLTTKKVIEVLHFKKGRPEFGAFIFKEPRIKRKRVIFEYSSEVVMSLKYHPKREQIVFDFLAPSSSAYEGIYEYYGPVLNRFDAFRAEKGHWQFVRDVDIKGEKRINDKYHNQKPDQEEKELYKK